MNEQQLDDIKEVAIDWTRYCELSENAEDEISVEDFKYASYAVLVIENEGLIQDFESNVYSEIEKVGQKLKSLIKELEAK